MNSRVVSAIALKDLVDAIRNRYLLAVLLTPLLVALPLRLLLPDVKSLTATKILVHDPGNSKLSAQLRAIPNTHLVEMSSAEAVRDEVQKQQAAAGLLVPANFDASVAAGNKPDVTVYLNTRKNVIAQATFRLLMEQQIISLVQQPRPAQLVWIDAGEEPASKTGREFNLNQMMLPLLLLLGFGMTGALVVPLLLVEEKEKRTLDFLLTSPVRLTEILAGKTLTGVVYSVLIAGILLALHYHLIGNWPLTLITIALGLLLIVAIGLLMGSLFKTTMQVNTWASLVLLLLLAPSFPFPGSPPVLDTAMRFVPTYYFVESLKMSLNGEASSRLLVHSVIVLVCTLVAFYVATWALRREQN